MVCAGLEPFIEIWVEMTLGFVSFVTMLSGCLKAVLLDIFGPVFLGFSAESNPRNPPRPPRPVRHINLHEDRPRIHVLSGAARRIRSISKVPGVKLGLESPDNECFVFRLHLGF